MKLAHCTQEEAVVQAAHSGDWSEPLRSHAARCPICSEVALVSSFLRIEAESARAEAVLPDPGRIWWKAQLAARREAAERALRPIALMEKLAVACGALCLGIAFFWQWPRISSWTSGWLGRVADLWTHRMPAGSAAQMSLPLVATLGLFLLLPVLLFGLYVSWSEE